MRFEKCSSILRQSIGYKVRSEVVPNLTEINCFQINHTEDLLAYDVISSPLPMVALAYTEKSHPYAETLQTRC